MNAVPPLCGSSTFSIAARCLLLPLLAATSASAGVPPPVSCQLDFVLQSGGPVGALQFDLDYSAASGLIPDSGLNVDCVVVAPGPPLTAINDDDGAQTLRVGVVDIPDTASGTPLVQCDYVGSEVPVEADFVLSEIDSAPGSTDGILSNVCGAPVTGAVQPFSRDSLVILRKAVGAMVNCQPCECDTNNDTVISSSDAIRALREAVGVSSAMICPACVGLTATSPASESVTIDLQLDCTYTCPAAPDPACATSAKGSLKISDDLVDDTKDSLKWKFTGGPEIVQADLDDPSTSTTYTACLYDSTASADSLETSLSIAPGADWVSKDPKGFNYKDSSGASDGVTKAQLKTGLAGKSKIKLTAKGAEVPMPTAFSGAKMFDHDPRVVFQLHNTASGECWSTQFDTHDFDSAVKFIAKAP